MGESFIIQISTTLVNRLVNDGNGLKNKTKKPKPKNQQRSQQPQSRTHQSPSSNTHEGAPSGGWPLQSPFFLPASHPPPPIVNEELDGIRSIFQESERAMERLQLQEAKMIQEVTKRSNDLHDKEFKLPYQKSVPCLGEKDACLECYKEHAKDPLKCAHLVKSFADCAGKARQQVFSS